jgi:hypothetical protein
MNDGRASGSTAQAAALLKWKYLSNRGGRCARMGRMTTLRSEALANGEGSWGAKYMVRGFTRSPETDLLYALGFPNMRRLVVDHPENALTGDALKQNIVSWPGPDLPAAHAARRVRTKAVLAVKPDGSWQDAAHAAFEDGSPFTEESAAAFLRAHLARKDLGQGGQWDIAFTLEALVGADVVAGAVVDAFEEKTSAELASDAGAPSWGTALGHVLLRTSTAVGDALVLRAEKLIERGFSETDVYKRSIAVQLDAVLHGHRRSERHRGAKVFFSDIASWMSVPKDVLADELRKADVNKWNFTVEPRLAVLGGDAVIDFYRERWPVLKEADDQRRLVEWFGEIVHPSIPLLIADMAEGSKVKKVARAWLDANGGPGGGAKAPARGASGSKPKRRK